MSMSVVAQSGANYADEAQALNALAELEREKGTAPAELLSKVEEIRSLSEQGDWPEAHLYASLVEIEALLSAENVTKARVTYDATVSAGIESSNPAIPLRYKVADLKIRQVTGGLGDSHGLYSELTEDAAAIDDLELRGDVYLAVGESQYLEGLYAEALQSSMVAYDLFDATGDLGKEAEVLALLGNIYVDQKQYEKGLEYFQRSLAYADQVGDVFLKSVVHFNTAVALKNTGRLLEAREEFSRAELVSEILGDEVGKAYVMLGIAFIEMELADWQSALGIFEKVLPVVVSSGNEPLHLNTLLGMTKSLARLGRFSEAEEQLMESESILDTLHGVVIEINFLKVAVELYAQKKDYEKAFFYLDKQVTLEHEANEDAREKELQDIQVKYDTELTERQNENLMVQNQLQALQLTENQKEADLRMQIVGLVAVILLFVLFFAMQQIRHRNRFKALANLDFLTNAPNRRAVIEYADSLFLQARKNDLSLFLAVVDLDNFKHINDKYGHNIGDKILKGFARACEETLRKEDGFGRYGGEEWLLVLPGISDTQVAAVFSRLKKTLNETYVADLVGPDSVTFSMGAAAVDTAKDDSVEGVIGRADALLYRAKEQGRDRLIVEP